MLSYKLYYDSYERVSLGTCLISVRVLRYKDGVIKRTIIILIKLQLNFNQLIYHTLNQKGDYL